ncbi:hypothetical protein QR680_007517 [Steinernema hermaphroditum]|uniref:Uncharacterized protein n=1 Tax=Steinernema hermaphroditum TaxID=289476 RepID=A0AA39IDF2_9BILA|nr:hypothetical protein QR680_007517 [Steinernema hermaphroditum]
MSAVPSFCAHSLESMDDSASTGSIIDSETFLGLSHLSLYSIECRSVATACSGTATPEELSAGDSEESAAKQSSVLITDKSLAVPDPEGEVSCEPEAVVVSSLNELLSEDVSSADDLDFGVLNSAGDYRNAVLLLEQNNVLLEAKIDELNALRQSVIAQYAGINSEIDSAEQSLKELCDEVDVVANTKEPDNEDLRAIYDRDELVKRVENASSAEMDAARESLVKLQNVVDSVKSMRDEMKGVFDEAFSSQLCEKINLLMKNYSTLQEDLGKM